ncbi:sulfurtransferase TusA family protein [candidate division WOR-3 bacterium]|nr:sulfurtransferase TusA family protein [candidate division WOR-3 bacterium]
MQDITVDARGLSCPQPVLETLEAIKKYESGIITVLVDTTTSRDNVKRAAEKKGFKAEIRVSNGGEFKVELSK